MIALFVYLMVPKLYSLIFSSWDINMSLHGLMTCRVGEGRVRSRGVLRRVRIVDGEIGQSATGPRLESLLGLDSHINLPKIYKT
jgi:hypothetical protein